MTRFGLVLATLLGEVASGQAQDVSFHRDIRPILASKCFVCHGPDESQREADLRLDVRDAALDYGAVVPGDPDQSEMVLRIASEDPDLRMPPDAEDALTESQVEQIRQWIAAGAEYPTHWAFTTPARPRVPQVSNQAWPRNSIDHFVLSKLEAEQVAPSPTADRYTLIRRLFLDLIGLPPSMEEADLWASRLAASDHAATTPAKIDETAYAQLVDQLLSSPRYGERWARLWLDLARYADTNGYEKDRPRSIWPYRDWVIRALNDDLPFDRFTIEQLAGDMLPDANTNQQIATGFHRNTMLNEEGGIDPLEYRFYAMVNRVATTGTVWMGLTVGCAQCHPHKYDPISHSEYYSLMALLNNADEPDLIVPHQETLAQQRTLLDQIAQFEAELPDHFPPLEGKGPIADRRRLALQQEFTQWLDAEHWRTAPWTVLRPRHMETNSPRLEVLEDGSIFSSGDITKRDIFKLAFSLKGMGGEITALRLEALPDDRLPARGPGRAFYEGRKGDFFLSEFTASSNGQSIPIESTSHSFGKISIGNGNANAENVLDGDGSTGWSTSGREGEAHQLVVNFAEPLPASGELEIELLFERHFAASLGRFRLSATTTAKPAEANRLPAEVEAVLARDSESRSPTERAELKRRFLLSAPELDEQRKHLANLRSQLPDLPTTMVMRERPPDNPRPTYRHHRGEYLNPRESAEPGLPAIFSSAENRGPQNRLEFAHWLVSRKNPLVGRVTANRAWRAFFGAGLVRTDGDFGTQSQPPTHLELLDWLACEFVDRDWSLKQLHRLIVTSATYRQSSQIPGELLRRDPDNRLLARGPRHRVDGEVVRDSLLTASGLLSAKMYGPSVYPPQPPSVTALAYGGVKWNPSKGEERYRRSIYTFSKRTAPFAAYSVFDSPSGETCSARRARSNTPLQALTMLNDPMYVEMAQALAAASMRRDADSPNDRAAYIFRQCLTRPPSDVELAELLRYQRTQAKRLADGQLDAVKIGGRADATPELASWAMVARVVMNLDEAITKQ